MLSFTSSIQLIEIDENNKKIKKKTNTIKYVSSIYCRNLIVITDLVENHLGKNPNWNLSQWCHTLQLWQLINIMLFM